MAKRRRDPRIDPASRSVNEELLERAILHAHFLQRYKAGQVREVVGFLNVSVIPDLLEQIDRELVRMERRGLTESARMRRLERSLETFEKIVEEGMGEAHTLFRSELKLFAQTEVEWQSKVMREVLKPVNYEPQLPSPRMIESSTIDRAMHGRFLDEWFEDLASSNQKRLSQQLRIGVAQGESIGDLRKRVEGKGGVLDTTRRETEAVVRTAVAEVANSAHEDLYDENTEVIEEVLFVATLDSRTTLTCASYDGQTFKVHEGPRPPLHFNCRSVTVPVLKSWDKLGIKGLKELPPLQRASMNGVVPGKMNYEQWLRKQSREVQEEALGKERARLFRKGARIDRFVDDAGKPLTLKQLRTQEGLE